MKRTVCLALLTGVLSFAQATAPAQNPPPVAPAAPAAPAARVSLLSIPRDTLIATVDGQKITAGDLQAVLRAFDSQQQQMRLADPRAFLDNYALLQKLSALAVQGGLDQKTPLKEQIAYNRLVALAQAQLQEAQRTAGASAEEIRKFYDSNPDLYTKARIKLIYIPFSPNASAPKDPAAKPVLSESEAKAKAEKLYAELQAGADFVKLVKENSGDPTSVAKDGDYTPIRKSDQIPAEIKNAVFALKPAEVARPIRQPNGFYIIRLEGIDRESFESVETRLDGELRSSRVSEWVRNQQSSIDIKIEYPAAFAPAPATAAPPAPAPPK
jgi:peptidyl-prolyl cis-trans isomerase C